MFPTEPVSLSGISLPLHRVKPDVLFTAAVPATAFGLTVTVTIVALELGHGLLDRTALYAVEAVNAPVERVALVPVAVDHVGVAAV